MAGLILLMAGESMKEGIAKKVKEYYEKQPYPRQRVLNREDLTKGEHEAVMRKILATIGARKENLHGMRLLDAGCGTGEKALYCALYGAKVDAFDLSEASIGIAKKNAERLSLANPPNYFCADFKDVKLEGEYDFILAIGTLHHTSDAKGNFMRIARHLKKGGRICLGLYNVYGRLACRLHRHLLWHGAKNADDVIAKIKPSENEVRRASDLDRYASPHETYHSVEEVLGWFDDARIMPIATSPKTDIGSKLGMKAAQIGWMLKNKGFFFVGAMKKD